MQGEELPNRGSTLSYSTPQVDRPNVYHLGRPNVSNNCQLGLPLGEWLGPNQCPLCPPSTCTVGCPIYIYIERERVCVYALTLHLRIESMVLSMQDTPLPCVILVFQVWSHTLGDNTS